MSTLLRLEFSPAGTLPQTAVADVHLPTGIFSDFFSHYWETPDSDTETPLMLISARLFYNFSWNFACLASFTGGISWRHCGLSLTVCRVSSCGHKIPAVLNFLEQVVKAEILLLNAFIQSRKGYELEVVLVSSLSRGSKLRGVENQ